uniref:Uncharacterized protein n=1 Tax=Acrobeloides nanus TaxID=290746 RepID=A0A914C1N0_9BILA
MLLQRAFYRPIAQSIRNASAVPKVGLNPPPLEQWDPLNPGEWQLGAGGKLVPRLPEGTRVGDLVMGKYGLYNPAARKLAQSFGGAIKGAKQPEIVAPQLRHFRPIVHALTAVCLVIFVWNSVSLVNGKLIWPYEGTKRRG